MVKRKGEVKMLRDYDLNKFNGVVKGIFSCYNVDGNKYEGVVLNNGEINVGYDCFNYFINGECNYGIDVFNTEEELLNNYTIDEYKSL